MQIMWNLFKKNQFYFKTDTKNRAELKMTNN